MLQTGLTSDPEGPGDLGNPLPPDQGRTGGTPLHFFLSKRG